MKKIILLVLFIIALSCVGGFIFIEYIKNKLADDINSISNHICKISYEDISMESFSLPLHFRFKINQLVCDTSEIIDDFTMNVDEAIIAFDLLDDYLNIELPKDVQVVFAKNSVSYSNLDTIKFIFSKKIFSLINSNEWLSNIQKISYNSGMENCQDDCIATQSQALNFDIMISNDNNEGKIINMLFDANHDNTEVKIDGSLHIVSQENGIGSSLNVKELLIKHKTYSINVQGDLLVAHQTPPYIRGKLAFTINNYQQLIDDFEDILRDMNEEQSLQWLDQVKEYANFFDKKTISIILQDNGKELYLGKYPLFSSFPAD